MSVKPNVYAASMVADDRSRRGWSWWLGCVVLSLIPVGGFGYAFARITWAQYETQRLCAETPRGAHAAEMMIRAKELGLDVSHRFDQETNPSADPRASTIVAHGGLLTVRHVCTADAMDLRVTRLRTSRLD